jgi:hypothetical protein
MSAAPIPPLRPILGPGEYRVVWQVPAKDGSITQLDGDLELIADRPPRATAYGELPAVFTFADGTKSASFPQSHDGGNVHGRMLNGMYVLLIDTTVEALFPDRTLLHARAALVGSTEPPRDVPTIARIEVQVEALDAFSAIPPIGEIRRPQAGDPPQRYLDTEWSARGEPGSTQTSSDNGAKVEFRYYYSQSLSDWWAFGVSFSPVVLITPTAPIDFGDAFSDWIEPLRSLVSISVGEPKHLTYVAVDLDGGDRRSPFQVYGSALRQQPFASHGAEVRQHAAAFRFGPDEHSLLALLRTWQQLTIDRHPLLETYGALLHARDQHPRSRFLLLVQAIEGLYGYETRATYDARVAAHLARRGEVFDALKSADADVLAFLEKFLMKRPPSSLDEAISKTLKAAPVDVLPVLKATRLLRGNANVPGQLRVIRNKLAHGERGYDPMDIFELVAPLDGVVRASLIRVLGGNAASQRKAQEPV